MREKCVSVLLKKLPITRDTRTTPTVLPCGEATPVGNMTTFDGGQISLRCGAFHKRFVLNWDQKSIVNNVMKDKHVLVTGPPGTGKTTVLMYKGLQWLKEGKDVLVLSIHRASIPTCWYLYTLLNEAKRAYDNARCPEDPEWGYPKFNDYVLADDESVQNALNIEAATTRPLCVLMDYMAPETLDRTQLALDFLKELKDRLPEAEICISDWSCTVPEGFKHEYLHVPVRFTNEVYELIKVPVEALELNGTLPKGNNYFFPYYHDLRPGPDVIHLRHKGTGSDDKWPINSEKCGRKVAQVLRQIGVGAAANTEEAKGDHSGGKGEHYQFRDVLIITRNKVKRGDTPPFVQGLEAEAFPTAVFGRGDYLSVVEALDDVVLAPEDKVMVMNNEASVGLDRKVVVCLTGVGDNETWELREEEEEQIRNNQVPAGTITLGQTTLNVTLNFKNEQEKRIYREKLLQAHQSEMEVVHRLTIWSRCCRQLIVVHLPEKVQGSRDFKFYKEPGKCVVM